MTGTDWPYDAAKDDPLTALRIPVIADPWPQCQYELALMITDDDRWAPAVRPDDREAVQIAAFLGFRLEWYTPAWRQHMRTRPFDTDPLNATYVLVKRGQDDWTYRVGTWETAGFSAAGPGVRLTLEQLLDRINDSAKWLAWKAAHPEAFGPVNADA